MDGSGDNVVLRLMNSQEKVVGIIGTPEMGVSDSDEALNILTDLKRLELKYPDCRIIASALAQAERRVYYLNLKEQQSADDQEASI